jgi:hypothetical protein
MNTEIKMPTHLTQGGNSRVSEILSALPLNFLTFYLNIKFLFYYFIQNANL